MRLDSVKICLPRHNGLGTHMVPSSSIGYLRVTASYDIRDAIPPQMISADCDESRRPKNVKSVEIESRRVRRKPLGVGAARPNGVWGWTVRARPHRTQTSRTILAVKSNVMFANIAYSTHDFRTTVRRVFDFTVVCVWRKRFTPPVLLVSPLRKAVIYYL